MSKNKESKLAFRSGSNYMMSTLLISATSLVTAPIFTRLLSTADYGIASNFAAWQTLGMVIIGLGLTYSIGNARIDFPGELDKYIASIQTLGSILGVVALLVVIQFRSELATFMEMDQSLVIIIFVFLLVFPSVIFAQERFKFILQYKQNVYISIVGTFGAIASCLVLIIYVFDENKYYGRIIGLLIPMFLMGIYFYLRILKEGWSGDLKKYWGYALKIGLPMVPHSLALVVLTQIDRIMITRMCGNSDNGLYSFGFSYGFLLALFSNVLLQAYQPWLYLKYKENDLLPIRNANTTIATVMCLVTILVIAVAPEALMVLGSSNFWEAKWVVMPVAIGALFQYISSTYTWIELYHKKTIVIAMGTIVAAIINYFLNLVFIPIFGYIGAAYAILISYGSLALFHLIACRMITKKQIFDDKLIWIMALLTLILSTIFRNLYDYTILRYSLLVLVLAVIAFIQRNKIVSVFNLMFHKMNAELE